MEIVSRPPFCGTSAAQVGRKGYQGPRESRGRSPEMRDGPGAKRRVAGVGRALPAAASHRSIAQLALGGRGTSAAEDERAADASPDAPHVVGKGQARLQRTCRATARASSGSFSFPSISPSLAWGSETRQPGEPSILHSNGKGQSDTGQWGNLLRMPRVASRGSGYSRKRAQETGAERWCILHQDARQGV